MENIEKKFEKTKIIFIFTSFIALVLGLLVGFSINAHRIKQNKFDEIYDILKEEWLYADKYDDFDTYLTDLAIGGMADNNEDPYTFYTSTYAAQNISIDTIGLGIGHTFYGGNQIISKVYKNSAADKANLKVGDVIVGFYDSSTSTNLIRFSSLSYQETLDFINNYRDEEVKMRVKSGEEERDVTIKKTYYSKTAVQEVECLEGEDTTVYVRIDNFLDYYMISDFEAKLDEIIEEKGSIDRLIIDLRDNGGGVMDYAASLASFFIPKNSIIAKCQTRQEVEIMRNNFEPKYAQTVKKINLLQNHNTASASEMFILALWDNIPDKVDIIGSYSYGKGIRQKVIGFPDGSALRYTDAYVLSPKGYTIHETGIKPTIEVKYDYTLTNYYGEIGFVTSEYREKILQQINGVLDKNFQDYNEALNEFLLDLPYDTFNYEVGRILQQKGFDIYLTKMAEIKNLALGA